MFDDIAIGNGRETANPLRILTLLSKQNHQDYSILFKIMAAIGKSRIIESDCKPQNAIMAVSGSGLLVLPLTAGDR